MFQDSKSCFRIYNLGSIARKLSRQDFDNLENKIQNLENKIQNLETRIIIYCLRFIILQVDCSSVPFDLKILNLRKRFKILKQDFESQNKIPDLILHLFGAGLRFIFLKLDFKSGNEI